VFVVVNTLARTSSLDFVIQHLALSPSHRTWSHDGASRSHVVTKSSIDKDRAPETLPSTARVWVRQRLLASCPRLQMHLITHTSNISFARTACVAPNAVVGDTAAPHPVLIGLSSHSSGPHPVSAQWARCQP
jgi:hypothetical protein